MRLVLWTMFLVCFNETKAVTQAIILAVIAVLNVAYYVAFHPEDDAVGAASTLVESIIEFLVFSITIVLAVLSTR